MTLPYDYSRCGNEACNLPCRRKEPGRPDYQVFSLFPGGEDCHARILPAGLAALAAHENGESK